MQSKFSTVCLVLSAGSHRARARATRREEWWICAYRYYELSEMPMSFRKQRIRYVFNNNHCNKGPHCTFPNCHRFLINYGRATATKTAVSFLSKCHKSHKKKPRSSLRHRRRWFEATWCLALIPSPGHIFGRKLTNFRRILLITTPRETHVMLGLYTGVHALPIE